MIAGRVGRRGTDCCLDLSSGSLDCSLSQGTGYLASILLLLLLGPILITIKMYHVIISIGYFGF